jgi:hypothetical protein
MIDRVVDTSGIPIRLIRVMLGVRGFAAERNLNSILGEFTVRHLAFSMQKDEHLKLETI